MQSSYIPVPTSDLPLNQSYDFDLYLTYNKKFILFRGRNLPVDEGVLNQLRDNGVDTIFVDKRDYAKYLKLLYQSEGYHSDNNIQRYLQDRFMPVDAGSLRVGSEPRFMVFAVQENIPNPLLAPDVPGLRQVVGPELPLNYERVYIFKKDLERYTAYLRETWEEEAHYSPMNHAGGVLVREAAKLAAHGLFHNHDVKAAMQTATESTTGMMERMLDNPETYYSLLKVSDQDFNTYIHSVNVAVLSMGLGMEMKLSDQQIHALGLGSMLHDIGKRELNPDLQVKKGKLTPSEYEELREHVLLGEKFCLQHPLLDPSVVNIVAQHHERLDGSGYPHKLKEPDLDPLGQIVALFEIYDALTNRQPFRNAFTPFEALEKMRQFGRAINQDFLSVFIRLLGNQKKNPFT